MFTLHSSVWLEAVLRQHDGLVCPGVESAHGAEFGGIRIVIRAGCLTSLACVIIFDAVAVGETKVLVFKSVVRCWLGFAVGDGHHVDNGRAV